MLATLLAQAIWQQILEQREVRLEVVEWASTYRNILQEHQNASSARFVSQTYFYTPTGGTFARAP